MKEFLKKHKYKLISVCSFLFVLLVWQLVTDVFHLVSPVMLPSPAKILDTLWYKLTGGTVPDGSSLFENIWSSLKIALGGYAVGVLIGVPLELAWRGADALNFLQNPYLILSVQYQLWPGFH